MHTNKKKSSTTTRILAVGITLAAGAFMVVQPALADDPDPEQQDGSCRSAVVNFGKEAKRVLKGDAKEDAQSLTSKYSTMRDSCSEFRQCKKSCRQAKRDAKAACKGLKGKAKRKCKKNARKEKRQCKQGCREEMKQSDCRSSRRKFWGTMGKVIKTVAKDKKVRKAGSQAVKTCKALYKRN